MKKWDKKKTFKSKHHWNLRGTSGNILFSKWRHAVSVRFFLVHFCDVSKWNNYSYFHINLQIRIKKPLLKHNKTSAKKVSVFEILRFLFYYTQISQMTIWSLRSSSQNIFSCFYFYIYTVYVCEEFCKVSVIGSKYVKNMVSTHSFFSD